MAEAAAYTSLSVRFIRGLVYSGEIPVITAGRRLILDRRDLDGYLDRHKIAPLEAPR